MTEQCATRHPLLEKKIVGIGSWEQWFERWQDVNTAEELISLLHYGFDVGGSVERDVFAKAKFYLALADGHAEWRDTFIGVRPDDVGSSRYYGNGIATSLVRRTSANVDDCIYTSAELRRLVSRKAWEVLCVKFFGGWAPEQSSKWSIGWCSNWGEREQDLEMITLLFDFFDPKQGANNFGSHVKHHKELLDKFLKDFVREAWAITLAEKPYGASEDDYRAITKICHESRPRLLNMILALGWEEMLFKLSFDERTLPHLEAAVADHASRQGKGWTLEECAADGYKPAQVALLLRNRLKVERAKQKKKKVA